MTTIQSVLFPVDFSPSCDALAPFVNRVADTFKAKVTLLFVLEPPASGFEMWVRPLPEVLEDQKKLACEKLQTYLSRQFPPPENSRIVAEGEPAAEIARVAREHGFGVICMPTHAGVFRRTLLGSTTAKVLNDADCPVLTTQHAENLSPRPFNHREWVCAIGLSADSERVLRCAVELANAAKAHLSLIHAIAPAQPGGMLEFDLKERAQSGQRQAAERQIMELQKTVGSSAEVRITLGPLKDALTESARRLEADALIIGRSSQPGMNGRLRDLTYAVIRDAPCPVVSV